MCLLQGEDLVDVIKLVIERRGDGDVFLGGSPRGPRDVDLALLLPDGLGAGDAVLEVRDE